MLKSLQSGCTILCLHSWGMRIRAAKTSLVVQWLRLQAPKEGGLGSIPGQEATSHVPQLRPAEPKKQINKYQKKK